MASNGTNSTKEVTTHKQTAILTFVLAGQEYGLPIHDVVQIIEMVAIVNLPRLPQHVQGIINFHGQVTAVVDVRVCLGLPFQPYHLHTPIILANCMDQLLALVVDEVVAVKEMATVISSNQTHNTLLTGIAQINQHLIPMLNLTTLLSEEDQAQVTRILENNANALRLNTSSDKDVDS
jgi:purine-binding chemotaxis protein CheW